MTVMKEMQFPVSLRWRGGRLVRADGRDKESLALATPPEFRDGVPGYWTPEDLLVASAASCAELETVAGGEAAVNAAAKAAEERCLIAQALDVPVHVAVSVTKVAPAHAEASR
jgi:organic hydroperoxide reductase OsmC/OhrA